MNRLQSAISGLDIYLAYYDSPLGEIEITTDDCAVRSVFFAVSEKRRRERKEATDCRPEVMERCERQLEEYFRGARTAFDLPMHFEGTDFQLKIWNALLEIPYGETISYLTLARLIGNEKAVRAVGQTNGANPISIIAPCHRVVGSNGKLVGYGGDLWRKEALLKHEMQYKPKAPGLLF